MNKKLNKELKRFAAQGDLDGVKISIEKGANNFDSAFIQGLLYDHWNIMEYILYGNFDLDWRERYIDATMAFEETNDKRWYDFGIFIYNNKLITFLNNNHNNYQ